MAYLEEIPKYAFGTAYDLYLMDHKNQRPLTQRVDAPSAVECIMAEAERRRRTGERRGDYFDPEARERTNEQISSLINEAIRLGCRHFDCAPLYRTQKLVGVALEKAFETKPRSKFFITSKVPPNMMQPENLVRSVNQSLGELKLKYLDLVLLHAPFSTMHVADDVFYPCDPLGNVLLDDSENLLANAWLTLAKLKEQGLVRLIGLSNVNMEQLIRLNKLYHVDVVQNEYHMYNQDRDLFDYCEEIDVHFEAYAAMGSPHMSRRLGLPLALSDRTVTRVSRRTKLTAAQVIIQWIHLQPLSYVIRSDSVEQLRENFQAIYGINRGNVLNVQYLMELDNLHKNCRIYHFTENKGLIRHSEYPFKDRLLLLKKLSKLASKSVPNLSKGISLLVKQPFSNKPKRLEQESYSGATTNILHKSNLIDLCSQDEVPNEWPDDDDEDYYIGCADDGDSIQQEKHKQQQLFLKQQQEKFSEKQLQLEKQIFEQQQQHYRQEYTQNMMKKHSKSYTGLPTDSVECIYLQSFDEAQYNYHDQHQLQQQQQVFHYEATAQHHLSNENINSQGQYNLNPATLKQQYDHLSYQQDMWNSQPVICEHHPQVEDQQQQSYNFQHRQSIDSAVGQQHVTSHSSSSTSLVDLVNSTGFFQDKSNQASIQSGLDMVTHQ